MFIGRERLIQKHSLGSCGSAFVLHRYEFYAVLERRLETNEIVKFAFCFHVRFWRAASFRFATLVGSEKAFRKAFVLQQAEEIMRNSVQLYSDLTQAL